MKRCPLVLVGAGGFARETVEVVAAINAHEQVWDLRGFVDDDPAMHGRQVCGLPVLGPIESVVDSDVTITVCVGSPKNFTSRARIVARLDLHPERYASLVHPSAVIPASVQVGNGSVVHAMTVCTGWARIGAHVAVMPAVVITHDDLVEDFVTLAAGVRIAGNVTVETGAYLGSGSLIREDLTIGAWSLIGMGSVVTKSVPTGEVWFGSPAIYSRSSAQNLEFAISSIHRDLPHLDPPETHSEQ